MKKIFITLPLAALLLAACQQDEPWTGGGEGSGRIEFATPVLSVETFTRATTGVQSALNVGDEFGVLGYCVPFTHATTTTNYGNGGDLWQTKKDLCPPDVFNRQRVTVGANGCTYNWQGDAGNNPKYWYRGGYDTQGQSNGSVPANAEEDYRYSFIAYYPYAGSWEVAYPHTNQNMARLG